MFLTEVCHGLLGIMKLLSQVDKTIAEPRGAAFGSLKTGIELFNDIGVSNCVGEPRRPFRINGRD